MERMVENRKPVELLEPFEFHVAETIEDAIEANHAMRPVEERHHASQCQNHLDGSILRERERER